MCEGCIEQCYVGTNPGKMSYTCFGQLGVISARLLPRSSSIGSTSGGGYAHILATRTILYASSSTNTANRKGLTEHHNLGSESLARLRKRPFMMTIRRMPLST